MSATTSPALRRPRRGRSQYWRAQRSGRGQHIDVSMLETMILSFTPYQPIFAQLEERLYGRSIEIPSIEPAADGWVGFLHDHPSAMG